MSSMHRCPGTDIRFWKPKDIFELRCPTCNAAIEFWKDDPKRVCPGCGKEISNPHLDLGCAKWCQYAEQCLGSLPDVIVADAPVVERLIAVLERELRDQPARLQRARALCDRTEALLPIHGGEPRIVKSAALLIGSLLAENNQTNLAFLQTGPLCDSQHQRALLEEIGIDDAAITRICRLVEHIRSEGYQNSPEFTVVFDALQQVGQEAATLQ